MKTVSASDANRNFSKILRDVQNGQEATITSHGRPVARIVPINPTEDRTIEQREAAKRELLALWSSRKPLNLPKFTRDELHDD